MKIHKIEKSNIFVRFLQNITYIELIGTLSAFIWLMCFSVPVPAHHGFAPHYDRDRQVTVTGQVVRFDFRNPHAYLYIKTDGGAGGPERWKCELVGSSFLSRQGYTAGMFDGNNQVTVRGWAARRDPHGCFVEEIRLADGRVIRRTNPVNQPAVGENIPAESDSITGAWVRKSFTGVSRDTGFLALLTEQGAKVHDNYDPVRDDPALRCSASSPVRAWGEPGQPLEIRRQDNEIIIQYEFMDLVRRVYLDRTQPPPGTLRSEMGYSAGRFDGASLIIETKHFSAGVLSPQAGDTGILHSAELVLTETLRINPQNGDLELSWVADDPAYFTAPLTGTQTFVRTDVRPGPYNCQPGSD